MSPCVILKYLRLDNADKYPIVGYMKKTSGVAMNQTSPPSIKSLQTTGSATTTSIKINQVVIQSQPNLDTKPPGVTRKEEGKTKAASAKSPHNGDERVKSQKSSTLCDLL